MNLPFNFTGTLQFDSNGAFNTGPAGLGQAATVVIGDGAAFGVNDGTNNPAALPQNFIISSSAGITSDLIQANFTGHITLTVDSQLQAYNDFQGDPAIRVSGVISGNHGLLIQDDTQNSNAPVVFAGANTYSGTTDVFAFSNYPNGPGDLQLSNSACAARQHVGQRRHPLRSHRRRHAVLRLWRAERRRRDQLERLHRHRADRTERGQQQQTRQRSAAASAALDH